MHEENVMERALEYSMYAAPLVILIITYAGMLKADPYTRRERATLRRQAKKHA